MAWSERLTSGRYRGVYRDCAGRRRSAGVFAYKAKAERAAAAKESRLASTGGATPSRTDARRVSGPTSGCVLAG
jgi:hypothetical protein